MVTSFEDLIAPLNHLPVHERKILRRAYDFARQAHAGQKRLSGEDYFTHCVAVAEILVEMRLDAAAIAAGLLHDVVEETRFEVEDIQAEFGEEIANLVAGVTKMKHLPIEESQNNGRPRRYRDPHYLRKTLLTMNDDVRAILIKLADRLHNMRTLKSLPSDRQQNNALETMEIFAPLASRLGIWWIKSELEDLSFRYLDPDRYWFINGLVDQRQADREADIERIIRELKAELDKHGIEAEVSGRPKHIYSIWRKMERKDASFDEILDVRAVRVIVPDIYACYQVLGIVHQKWKPIAGQFDDYIAAPKDNFYQSLHTAVFLPDGKTLEVQIRTHEMHIHAEYGIAAHWRYKENDREHDEVFERRLNDLRNELKELGSNIDNVDDFLDVMRSEVFEDRVYAFTPHGDIIDLPAGSTPIDFAYHIHTDLGHRCRGAKVNGKLVSLDYKLKVGDRVEILTAKRGGPSRDWLNPSLGYVKTKRAITKIRQWFRKQDQEKMIALGREVLERELKRLGLEKKMSHEQVAKLFNVDKTEDLLAQIGFGDIQPQHIAVKVLELERDAVGMGEQPLIPTVKTPSRTSRKEIQIQGTGGLLTHLSRCCNPVQGDEIIGYITRGRGVSIHRKDCPNVLNLSEQERLIAVEWGGPTEQRYPVPVVINAYDREGLMRDIGAAIAEEHINISGVDVRTHNHIATFTLTMGVESAAQLSRILAKIERLPNVIEARRATSSC